MINYEKVEFEELILLIDENYNVIDYIIKDDKDNDNNIEKDKVNEE